MMIEKIGKPAMLEQLAEEAAELSQAALKLARVIRNENPTPVTAMSQSMAPEARNTPMPTSTATR